MHKLIALIVTVYLCTQCIEHTNCSPLFEDELNSLQSTEATQNQFPFQVVFHYTFSDGLKRHGCSGVILNERWVLARADCNDAPAATKIVMIVGTNDLNKKQRTTYKPKIFIRHPSYTDESFLKHNIGLVKTTRRIRFNKQIQPVPLYTKKVDKGLAVQISGWVRNILKM